MKLRFLQKKNGAKVLQMAGYGLPWTDVPMVKERNVIEELESAFHQYRGLHCKSPTAFMLGVKDYEDFLNSDPMRGYIRPTGHQTLGFNGVPVHRHLAAETGVFILEEAK